LEVKAMTIKLDVINPKVKSVTIGIKTLRDIKIYPLSVRDQLNISDIIVNGIKDFYADGMIKSEAAVASWLIDLIQNNVSKIIEFVTDKEEIGDSDIFAELTNEQLVELVDIIYEANFGAVSKKVKDLLNKIKEQFLSRRSSAKLSEDTHSTDLKTSSGNLSEKGD
jgi:hypothetical protein